VSDQTFCVARSFGTHYVITANLTDDGAPVYLRENGSWSLQLSDARAIPVDDEAERDACLTRADSEQRRVCDPYAFKVDVTDGVPKVTTTRERIRATGPTTPLRRPDADSDRLTG
jgi:hypothetical protein